MTTVTNASTDPARTDDSTHFEWCDTSECWPDMLPGNVVDGIGHRGPVTIWKGKSSDFFESFVSAYTDVKRGVLDGPAVFIDSQIQDEYSIDDFLAFADHIKTIADSYRAALKPELAR